MATLAPSRNADWDREVGFDKRMLAVTQSNIMFDIVDVTVDNSVDSNQVAYSSGYSVNLRSYLGIKKVLGLIRIDGKPGHTFVYNNSTDKIQQYNDTGSEVATAIVNANFPIRFLVLGM